MITFFIPGIPATAGSKRGFPIRRKNGSIGVAMAPDNERAKPWMSHIASEAAKYFDKPIDGAVTLTLAFELTRPKGHFGAKGNLKLSSPRYPTKKPDITKLVRAVEDALKGIAWHDDSCVVSQSNTKRYSERNGVTISIDKL